MGSGHTLNPTGGVLSRRGLEEPASSFHSPVTAGDLDEAPRADPHAGCCGGWGRKTPGYPIGRSRCAADNSSGFDQPTINMV